MSDIVIHTNQLSGSPILSYGDTGIRSSKTKLLAVLAGGFVLLVIGLFTWFWFCTHIPLPNNTILSAVIPAGTKLPERAPEIWKTVLADNDPLPALVGYAKADDASLVPFAVRFPSLFSRKFYSTGNWELAADVQLKNNVSGSPFSVFSWPWSALKQKQIWLALYPQIMFGEPGLEVSGLPERIQGYMTNHAWITDLVVGDAVNSNQDAKNVGGMTSQIPLLTENQMILHNFFASQGLSVRLPEKNMLTWEKINSENQLKIDLNGPVTTDTLSGLAQAVGLFDESDYLLPDSVMMQGKRPALKVFSSSTKPFITNGTFIFPTSTSEVVFPYHINSDSETSAIPSIDQSSCPGSKIAYFNASSLQNICTWLNFCFIKPGSLQINDNQGLVTFCY